jgi:hypothetical protein
MFVELRQRELRGSIGGDGGLSRRIHDSVDLAPRLALQRTLEGHNGCVNTCAFDETGAVLAAEQPRCQWHCLVLSGVAAEHRDSMPSLRSACCMSLLLAACSQSAWPS